VSPERSMRFTSSSSQLFGKVGSLDLHGHHAVSCQ
jgi:hypothetical protein